MVGAVGIENNAEWNFKDLEEMLGSAKTLKRNNTECKEILIGPSMAPRFFESTKFLRGGFCSHCLRHKVGFRPKFPQHGWQADERKGGLRSRPFSESRKCKDYQLNLTIICSMRWPTVFVAYPKFGFRVPGLVVPLESIHRPEASGACVEISGAVVVEVEVGVELFAGEEKFVGRGRNGRAARRNAGRGRVEQVAEGVVVVGNY